MQSVLVRPQVAVVQACGSLSATNAIALQAQLNTAILSEQNVQLMIDMGQVESIDNTGLMALVSALKLAKRLNKSVSLCGVSCSIRMVLELSQLDKAFEIHEGRALVEQLAA